MPTASRLSLYAFCLITTTAIVVSASNAEAQDLTLQLRYQQETSLNSGRFHQLTREESWKPEETAIIVCDVWDYHHCLNAVRRVEEFVPRLNDVLVTARRQDITIIHSPSDCMAAYEDHPARRRAIETPTADFIPNACTSWCSKIPSEERGIYPIDQTDGGEDDDPQEHEEWAQKLKTMGRNPAQPWKEQSDKITIDSKRDYISDKGDEVWNILQAKGIKNVILTGVHTNMCVLGRPFGLRQMARNGKNVVLMRDMTDTMYNPKRWPFVSHFTGTDLIVSHIERYVCPTITSDQFIGGKPFRFRNDHRPHLVMLIAEEEYRTEETLPRFAAENLGREFRVTTVFGSNQERNSLPGIHAVSDADVLLISIRRRVLPDADMQLIREKIAAGTPVIGIRTASHAFSLRNEKPPEGFSDWPEFDADVFGGSYSGHHGNELKSTVAVTTSDHEITNTIDPKPTQQGGSLYKTSPLAAGTTVLTTGTITGLPPEPVSWTFIRKSGGRSFYTSMGHVDDFSNPAFTKLLYQGICWAANVAPSSPVVADTWERSGLNPPTGRNPPEAPSHKYVWYRCGFRLPPEWSGGIVRLHQPTGTIRPKLWINGHETGADGKPAIDIPDQLLNPGDANIVVLRFDTVFAAHEWPSTLNIEVLREVSNTGADRYVKRSLLLSNRTWQRRFSNKPTGEHLITLPLPGKFGLPADIVHELEEPLWTARPVTRPGEFTSGIEGPACGPQGHIFAVNFQTQGTIGRVTPKGSAEVFLTLPKGSIGNGIRFDRDGNFFVADYPQHNILKVNAESREVAVLAHNSNMNQPNDLAIAPDGTLYASDPNWQKGCGQIWRIDTDGTTTLLQSEMGTTNGIEVSPDGETLYVNESQQRNIWAFHITSEHTLADKRLIRQFPDYGFDGMRCDSAGNLYVTRYGKGTVIKMAPSGDILREVNVLGSRPSNLCFGGADGRTVYVTEVDYTRLVSFRVDQAGRAWAEQQQSVN